MDVTTEKLTAAVDGMEVVVDIIGSSPPGMWTTARIRYVGEFASAVMARLAGQPEAEPAVPGHAGEAAQALSASVWQRQKWGESALFADLQSAQWEMERAKVHALLDVGDAVRELASALDLGGVRDDLGEIGHAIRKNGGGG